MEKYETQLLQMGNKSVSLLSDGETNEAQGETW